MKQRTGGYRLVLALLSAVILLAVEALPAFASCRCGMSSGDTCCDAPTSEPDREARHACCPHGPTDRDGTCLLGLAAPCCHSDGLPSDLSSVTVPATSETKKANPGFAATAVGPVPSPDVPDGYRSAPVHLRGPPGPDDPAIYLLNRALRL